MAKVALASVTTPHSVIREIGRLADQHGNAIRLEIGDPPFTTPEHIIAAAARAASAGFTRYTPSAGLLSLRELVADKLATRNRLACEVDEIVITTGGCGGLFATLLVLIDPGDEVLIPDPGWPNYQAMVHMLGGIPVFYRLRRDHRFEPDFDDLEAKVTERSKALVTNSPGNPTGAVFARDSVEQLIDFVERRDLWHR